MDNLFSPINARLTNLEGLVLETLQILRSSPVDPQQAEEIPIIAFGELDAHKFEDRLQSVEQKLDALLSFYNTTNKYLFKVQDCQNGKTVFETASIETQPMDSVGCESFDSKATRAKLVQIVRTYAVQKNVEYRIIWRCLYQKLKVWYGFNAALNRQSEKESYLDAVDRCGHIANLYAIASTYLIVPEL